MTDLVEQLRQWSRVWHDTCETMVTLLGMPGSGSPQELLAQVQFYIEQKAAELEKSRSQLVKCQDALKFYADPDNWIMAEWGDDDTSTEKAIPVVKEDGATFCDCGDRARAALTDDHGATK